LSAIEWSASKVPEAFGSNAIISTGLSRFQGYINFCKSRGLILSGRGSLYTASSRPRTLVTTAVFDLFNRSRVGLAFSMQPVNSFAYPDRRKFRYMT
jgi:hypothetical protein